ncbi:hypothetical protein BGZ59_007536 [Podila verticillata]|nr:hypothetical protein BGZ59_007536 [Podila verticillata]
MASTTNIELFCLVDGESMARVFPVKLSTDDSIGELRKLIKTEKAPEFDDIATNKLTLWRVSIPITDDDNEIPILLNTVTSDKKTLGPATRLSKVFPEELPEETVHIIVQRPPQVHTPIPARASTPLPGYHRRINREEWQQRVAQIEDAFFADNYTGLVQFVRGGANIPTTGGTLGGLPFVLPRAGGKTNQPSLLFLNLPESVETQDPPSTADRALEKIRGRAIPLLPFFGVSGCGKTRTSIEMLFKNWGFYFNGSGTDWGSGDLLSFLELVQQRKQYQNCDLRSNTHVHILALALVLSRVIILHHCLNIAEREGTTFTCKHWMLRQFGFRTMGVEDLFALLFTSIADEIHLHSVNITIMSAFAQERFSSLRRRLLNLSFNMPSQRFGYKILLVIDEAQNLGKEEFGTFLSQQIPPEAERRAGTASLDNYMRPILFPFIEGFYHISADQNDFCVLPCGTGLSILDMKWLEDSAPVTKGYQERLGPFTDFQGWESLEQVRHYRDLVRCSLPNADARNIFNSRVPDESIPELFARLRGRFRPIVSAIGK